jgi:hypothetical protein
MWADSDISGCWDQTWTPMVHIIVTAMKRRIHRHLTHPDQRPLRPPKILQSKMADIFGCWIWTQPLVIGTAMKRCIHRHFTHPDQRPVPAKTVPRQKLFTGVNNTSDKFIAGMNNTGDYWKSVTRINGPNGIFRSPLDTDSWKKPEVRKSCVRLPLKSVNSYYSITDIEILYT